MFADSLNFAWDNRSHRGWTTAASFAAQILGVGILLLLPLVYTQGLPQLQLLGPLIAPAPPPGPPRDLGHVHSTNRPQSNLANGIVIVPREMPIGVPRIVEDSAPPQAGEIGIPFGTGDRWSRNSVLNSIASANAGALPPPPAPTARPPRVSRMMEGNLVHKVQPEYPAAAKAARIQGAVVLQAIISKDGSIANLHVLSGHPMLVKSAIDAVSQWRYRPYYLNGDPVEVETQVTVNFVLAGG